MNNKIRNAIFTRLKSSNPHPRTELEYETPFQLLISVILTAQSTDRAVNIVTKKIFQKYGTPEELLNLGEESLIEYIKSIGLYRNKAKNILKTCQIILDKHAGQVPKTRSELESLPGVGRKTANVLLNVAFGMPTIAVDTHVFRVANRTNIAIGKNVLEVEKKLLEKTPNNHMYEAHHLLMLLGRYICIARKPKCKICPINDLCGYKYKTS